MPQRTQPPGVHPPGHRPRPLGARLCGLDRSPDPTPLRADHVRVREIRSVEPALGERRNAVRRFVARDRAEQHPVRAERVQDLGDVMINQLTDLFVDNKKTLH